MTKVLNLDDIETTIERTIRIKGVDHKMVPFSVEEFVNQMKELEEIGDKVPSASEIYETSLKMISRAFPSLGDEALRKLNTFQVDAIHNFLKAKTDEELEKAVSGNA